MKIPPDIQEKLDAAVAGGDVLMRTKLQVAEGTTLDTETARGMMIGLAQDDVPLETAHEAVIAYFFSTLFARAPALGDPMEALQYCKMLTDVTQRVVTEQATSAMMATLMGRSGEDDAE